MAAPRMTGIGLAALALCCGKTRGDQTDSGKHAERPRADAAAARVIERDAKAADPLGARGVAVIGDASSEPVSSVATKISLRREACIPGYCPVYDVDVYANGSVQYYGTHWVAETGPKAARVNPADVERLARRLVDTSFFALEWQPCERRVDDGPPNVHLALEYRGRRWTRVHRLRDECAPELLSELEAAVDALAGTSAWVSCDAGGSCRNMEP